MRITNFEQFLSEAVQHEGQDIFVNEQVSPPKEDKANHWQASVSDHEGGHWEVSVQLSNTTVKEARCNCDREGWPCAHIVAVLYQLYAMREEQKKANRKETKKPARQTKKDPVKEVLGLATKEDLERFIKSQFKHDRLLRVNLISELGHLLSDEEVDAYRLSLRKAREMALGKGDAVTTRNQMELYTTTANRLLKKGQKAFHKENDLDTALKVSVALLETIPAILRKSRVGASILPSLLGEASDLLNGLMGDLPVPRREEMLVWLIERMQDEDTIQSLEPLIALMNVITDNLGPQEDLTGRFEKGIEAILQKYGRKDAPKVNLVHYRPFDTICQETVMYMIGYYYDLNRMEDARQIADRFSYMGPVRYERAKLAIEDGQYETARKMAMEFLQHQPAHDYTGQQIFTNLLHELKTAKQDKPVLPPEVSSAGEPVGVEDDPKIDFLSYGQLDDYEALRARHSEKKWHLVRRHLLSKMGHSMPIHGDTQWTEIYRYYDEGDWESMLAIVQKHPHSLILVGQFGSELYFEFPDEMRAVFRQCFRYHFQQTNGLADMNHALQILYGLLRIVAEEGANGKLGKAMFELLTLLSRRQDIPADLKAELKSELSKLN